MKGKILSGLSIAIGTIALTLTGISFVYDKLVFDVRDPLTIDASNTPGLEAAAIILFVQVILSIVGLIYSLIIAPICIIDHTVPPWIVGLLLNLLSLILNIAPIIVFAVIVFLVYCFSK